jgi:PAS domain S-box-containing protein
MAGEGILVVEDDGILAANLQDLLSGMGYRVVAAVATGEQAVAAVDKGPVDLVLMDIELAGEMNGIAAAELIRATSDVPIVFLTGYSQSSLIQQAKVTAPAGYLVKPVPAPELQATIETALYRQTLDRELMNSRERFRTLVENIPGTVYRCEVDPPWAVRYLSEAVVSLTGCSVRDLMQEVFYWGDLIHEEDFAEVAEKIQHGIERKEQFAIEYRIHHADGGCRWVQQTGKAIFSASGSPEYIDGVMLDVTERRMLEQERLEMERQLLAGRRFESLVTLAGGVAHDFNNILTAVYGNMEMALRKLSPDSPARIFVEEALLSSNRSLILANKMLAFTGQGHRRLEIVDLNEVVRRTSVLSPADAAGPVSVRHELHRPSVYVRADPDQMRQVVQNLLNNAVEAVNGPGCTLSVATGVMECTDAYLAGSRIAEKPPQGRYANLDVTDTGCGMDQEILSRLFDPFFSTKFLGRGLGMPVVYGIVKGHGGAIMLDSQLSKGTTVRVLLPLAE